MEAQPQHMVALETANKVRLAQAEIKRQVRAGKTTVAEVVTDLPFGASSMKIYDLVMAQNDWGRQRTLRLLFSLPLPESKQLGTMTSRQKESLCLRLPATKKVS